MNRPRETILIGIIGVGGIARSSHLPAICIARDAGWPVFVSAIADPMIANVAFARDLLARCGAVDAETRWFDDGEALLDNGEIDAALILTPPSATTGLALKALDRAIPALVEKPVANSVDVLARLIAAEARLAAPPLIRVAYNRRSQPLANIFRTEIARTRADSLPGTVHVEARLWRTDRTDAIFYEDTMVHALDFVQWTLGPMEVEHVDRWPPFTNGGLSAGMRVLFRTTGDASIAATASLDVRPAVGRDLETYEVHAQGRSGVLNFPMWSPQNRSARLTIYSNGNATDIPSPEPDTTVEGLTARGFVPQLTRFFSLIAGGSNSSRGRDLCTLAEALETLKMRHMILSSRRETAE